MSHLSISCLFYHFLTPLEPEEGSKPMTAFLPQKSHGQRILVDYSAWGHRVGPDWATILTYLHPCRKAISLIGILFLPASNRMPQKSALTKRNLLPFIIRKSKIGRSEFMQLLNIQQGRRLTPFCCFFICCLWPSRGGSLLYFHTSNLYFRQEQGGRRKMRADVCLGDKDLRLHVTGQIAAWIFTPLKAVWTQGIQIIYLVFLQ